MELATRKLSDIITTSDYLRFNTDVETLKKSIANVGLINPLTINEKNELLAGARRFQAITELGWTEVTVHLVDNQQLEQELISIDENLVRTPLNKLELERCLNRGREIYEQLNPTAVKVNLSTVPPDAAVKAKQQELDKEDTNSFAALTAEKTGLSRSVIRSAIKRDELASDSVKKARGMGELNASQTNVIIELDKDIQEEVLPLIADKTVKETRDIVKAVKRGGLAAAIEENEKHKPLPKEFSLLRSPLRAVNKKLSRILLENLQCDGPEKETIHKELRELKEQLEQYFTMADKN